MQPPSRNIEELRARAEEAFKDPPRSEQQAPKATREYREAEQATRDRTTQLRAERLAREAKDKT